MRMASTQVLKNKDIPGDVAKGTILPSIGANCCLFFEKYVSVCLYLSWMVVDLLIMSSRLSSTY
jgi:hypothetical protein